MTTTQADNARDQRGLGRSLDSGGAVRTPSPVAVLIPVSSTDQMVRRPRSDESCRYCGARARLVLVTGSANDFAEVPVCTPMDELRVRLRHQLTPCPNTRNLDRTGERPSER